MVDDWRTDFVVDCSNSSSDEREQMKIIRSIVTLCLLCIVPLLSGCSPLETQAYRAIVGAKAFIDAEHKIHPECTATATQEPCTYLVRAAAAKDLMIDAAEVYCSGPQFEAGGKCQPPSKGTAAYDMATAKLKAAISTYSQAQSDFNKAVK